MNKLIITLAVFALFSCSDPKDPATYFSKEDQDYIILQSVRYSAKLPPASTHETKFKAEFDEYYSIAAKEVDFRRCLKKKEDQYFFLMTRQARSIWPAREAIGGKMKVNKEGKLLDYEEVFRTWKMTEDTLNTRAFELFDRMTKGEDLTPFRTKYKGDRYIEFPDDRNVWSIEKKRWKDKVMDSLMLIQ